MSAQRRESNPRLHQCLHGVRSKVSTIEQNSDRNILILMITNSIGQRDDEQDGHVGMSGQLLAWSERRRNRMSSFLSQVFSRHLRWNRKKGKKDHTFFVAGRSLSHIGFQKEFDHFYIIQLSFVLGKIWPFFPPRFPLIHSSGQFLLETVRKSILFFSKIRDITAFPQQAVHLPRTLGLRMALQ